MMLVPPRPDIEIKQNKPLPLIAHTILQHVAYILIVVSIIFISPLTFADNLALPELNSQPPNSSQGVVRPVRGQTMDEVREQFGTPMTSQGPIGKPPITRWLYDQFTVVFEDDIVIHSFVK